MSAYPRRANEKEVARRAVEEMKRKEDILCSDKPLRVFTDLVSRQNPAINRCAQRKSCKSWPSMYHVPKI